MGVFQLEGGPDAVAHALAGPHHLRRRGRPGRPVPAGPDGRQHAPRLRRPEERPPAGHLPPPRPRGDPRRHLRPDDLPGVGHAGGPEDRRLRRWPRPTTCARPAARRSAPSSRPSARSSWPAAWPPATTRPSAPHLFDIIEPFADYAFNKSHAYGYGFIAYQTAWLKAHYPVEYLASLLTSVKDNKDKTAVYLAECRSLGIEVLVPDVNRSLAEFAADFSGGRGHPRRRGRQPRGHHLRAGRGAQRGRGAGRPSSWPSARRDGPFVDFYDFCQRVDPQVLNKRTIESLIKAGGFDSLGHPRQGLCLVFEEIVDRTLERRREHDAGVVSLFASLEPRPARPGHRVRRHPDPHPRHRVRQVAAAGLREGDARPLHQRPPADGTGGLAGPADRLHAWPSCGTPTPTPPAADRLGGYGGEGQIRLVGGVVTELQRRYTKKGDLMATFVLEDLNASIEVVRLPEGHGRLRGAPRRRRHRGPEGPGGHAGRPAQAGVHGGAAARAGRGRAAATCGSRCPSTRLTDRTVDGLKRLLLRASRRLPGLPPRRREGAPAALRVQRRQPPGSDGRAAGAARAQRHPVLNGLRHRRGAAGGAATPRSEAPLTWRFTAENGRGRAAIGDRIRQGLQIP